MDVNTIIDKYLELQKRESEQRDEITYRSAEATTCNSLWKARIITRTTYW